MKNMYMLDESECATLRGGQLTILNDSEKAIKLAEETGADPNLVKILKKINSSAFVLLFVQDSKTYEKYFKKSIGID